MKSTIKPNTNVLAWYTPASFALRARYARLAAIGYDKWRIRNDPVYKALIGAEFRSIYGKHDK